MKKHFQKIATGVSALSIAAIGTANAALDATATGAIGTAVTDAGTLGGLVIGAIVAAVVFKYIRRAV